ncbi:MAG TPA: M1 family aminopeptidase [Acidobacteriaceae bacterium]
MLLRCGLLVLGLIIVCSGGARAQRLPGGVRPEHYSLTITPDLVKARFAGSETIEVVLDRPASAITLNAAEIEFGVVRAFVAAEGGAGANAGVLPLSGAQGQNDNRKADDALDATVALNAVKEQATFTFARELPAGPVTLQIAYRGILNDKLRGFYLSKTKTRSYGVTQFEATDARRAFPSFDEPALKATFDVSLVVDAGDTAISNTKMVSDTPGPVAGKHTLKFATTPKMSTYLVAWVVGDFACTEGKSDGVPIRACATPDKVELTRFALEAAKWSLHYYDKYFGIKYPMAKLDLVAIPDFESGAMENFGCITYRETEMLVDSKNGTLPARKDVATTVAHEMAHQWFGDLVTPDWWDNLWLNEGFATWMETKAAAKWRPKWNYAQDEATDRNRTMDEDGERTTRAIQAKAETPAEINEMFDDIAYGKAGAVIGMVENWVGEETFRKGVHAYLSAHLYGNAKAEDFWDAQARVSGLPVDQVMRSFVEQPGVPEVTLKTAGADAQVTQSRFSLNPTHDGNAVMNGAPSVPEAWTIPVCFTGASCRLLTLGLATMDVPASGHAFVYANAGDKGYYRTEYSAPLLAAIVANAESRLTPPERIGLLGDRWALMRAGPVGERQGTVGEFLDLALAVKQDSDATVLGSALGKVGAIGSLIATDEDRERLNQMVRREFGPVYAAMGGPRRHESFDHAELRETLFEALGNAKDPAVMAEADRITKQVFAGQRPADGMIADAAIALTTPKGDAEMYDRLMRLSEKATDPDFKEAALHALTRFQTPALVTRTLEYAVSDSVRSQDSWMLIARLLERRETQEQAWAFVREHWAAIERKSTTNSGARIVEAAGAFCTAGKRDEVASFFEAHPVASSARTLSKAIDNINDCIHMRSAQEPELRRWLDAHGGS